MLLRHECSRIPLLALLLATPAGAQLVANAGPDIFLLPPADRIELHGAIRGLKHSQLPSNTGITWAQLSGPPATLLERNTLTPTLVPNLAGSLRLRLKVVDPEGGIDTDEVLVYAFGDDQTAQQSGEARVWHKLSFTFTHDVSLGEASGTNPFLDLRLTVHFYNSVSGKVRSVPGFFAADGNAAETSATSGTQWRVNFTPDCAGPWYYVASFRSGANIALDPNSEAGQPASFDGGNGAFYVEPADPSAPGFLAQGALQYVGGHHLRCAETHEFFLKSGTDSPENFLGYYGFDNTFDQGGVSNALNNSGSFDGRHHFNAHFADYVDLGVPLWIDDRGRRIFGALNYLASRGVNSVYALTYNIDGGDGQEVWPWFPATDKTRFDVSKLEQWERVLDHMTRCGIAWHVITQETENDHVLDLGALGPQRKLYYRELVARFAHAPALVWNLGEENGNTPDERKAFADYIRGLDPYDHPIALHNRSGDLAGSFDALLGTHLELVSLQSPSLAMDEGVQQLIDDSAAAGRPWVANFDEQGPAIDGALPDAEDSGHDVLRQLALWPTLLAGGGGCEWYFGYAHPHSDLDCEDFRSRDNLWRQTTRAREFLRDTVPFDEMQHADALAAGNASHVLAKRGEFYLAYTPFGGSFTLDLEQNVGPFAVRWFDAENGGALQLSGVTQVLGPGVRSIGAPPGPGDWVALLRRTANVAPAIESITIDPFAPGHDFALRVHAADPNGALDALTVRAEITAPNGAPFGTLPLPYRGGTLYSLFLANPPAFAAGPWQVRVTAEDPSGLSVESLASFTAP